MKKDNTMTERDCLLRQLTVLDFAAVDLQLYLDTHPDDEEALAQYNEAVMQADALRAEYEDNYGPMFNFRSLGGKSYTWLDDPWPWQRAFNFSLKNQ
jgi:spore coat protein JB